MKVPETTLGRVVVYRNGVAYFERYAEVSDNSLNLQVPADKIDDFLKSLTVSDAATNKPEPVSYPTDVPSSGTGLVDMKIQLSGAKPHKLKLTYVTEAPSWKPSYRISVGKSGRVHLQAWAIVDNTSGEDWQKVRLGVGSSSAMSFRFDLRQVRVVERETLQSDDLFAVAPPMGGSSYGSGEGAVAKNVLAELDDAALAGAVESEAYAAREVQRASRDDARLEKKGKMAAPAMSASGPSVETSPKLARQGNLAQLSQSLNQSRGQIVVEGYATSEDRDKMAESLNRANRARESLIKQGISADRIVALGKGEQPGKRGGVRVFELPLPSPTQVAKSPAQANEASAASKDPGAQEPIGTSHFESESPMTVPRGTSAMVSILHTEADGEVVYLYDPESARGNVQFPFRSVRLKNPTESALESGPVSVFGEGRFIGEGLSEPIPAHAQAFIPFALDRQIVVERKDSESDHIQRIMTVQRGIFHTEQRHVRHIVLTLHNRLAEKAVVFVKHTVPSGYALKKGTSAPERLGEAYLFRVAIEPGSKAELSLEESTPTFKTTDIRSPDGASLMGAYLSSAVVDSPLKKQVDELLRLNTEMANIEQRIATTREQMSEYRTRMQELHEQIVTLRKVKTTSGLLLTNLERKLSEISDKLSKATVAIVGLQEQAMVARIRFQDGVAELSLESQPSDGKEASKPEN